ncbi:ABC transporter ATP-binding protein [Paraferrimonas haliotis]|uniref:ABC cobalamin uptake system ATPase BtuD n=1 Tax=Paraferrimonas haliotis TaxID=2013866 RepID=A0AA37TNC4_9GAMM|nr:ABC transporter ATP-binding protein [Paraferrimonas haliotis]GLS83608.1 ABC cobalamin uptake system ATPase BtuD [Paraferrimonas haliotis]
MTCQQSQNHQLRIRNLSWHVAGKAILEQVSVDYHSGELLGVIGPNGAGKSSLLRCIYRYINNYQGSIEFEGQSLQNYSRLQLAQRMSVVLQHNETNSDANVLQWISLGRTPFRSWRPRIQQQEQQILQSVTELMQLEDLLAQPISKLSGGELQRCVIARALVQQPSLLLLDEPTNHLDVGHQMQIMAAIKGLSIGSIACIHDLNLAAAYCDRLLLLNNGRVVAMGTPAQVLTQENLRAVFGVHCRVDIDATGRLSLRYHYPQPGEIETLHG